MPKASKGLPGSASNKTKQAGHLRYASEDRAWWAKYYRLGYLYHRAEARGKDELAEKYRTDWHNVLTRAPAHLRMAAYYRLGYLYHRAEARGKDELAEKYRTDWHNVLTRAPAHLRMAAQKMGGPK